MTTHALLEQWREATRVAEHAAELSLREAPEGQSPVRGPARPLGPERSHKPSSPPRAAMIRARHAKRAALDALQHAFVDVMAHELKTPLATIYGGLVTLSTHGDKLSAAVRAELLADATAEAERLVWLVDDLVALSRVNRTGEPVVLEPLLLTHIVARVVQGQPSTTAERFAVSMPQAVTPVGGESAYVVQVLRNLVSNAWKYGAPPFEISVEDEQAGVSVRVLDSGEGIAGDPEQLFEIYYREPGADSHALGSGIGLFVASELIELMGGRMWALNRVGGGAEFGFFLPAWPAGEE